MRAIDASEFAGYFTGAVSPSLGQKPALAWIPIDNLRIDPAYQREVLTSGGRNIGKIARDFDWALFGVCVVASIGDNLFAIVDGQHRTLGAALRQIAEVPCVIIEADPGKQASAFAAINGAVTKISPLQIFNAKVAAGDSASHELVAACAAAGVEICRYPVPANKMKLGQTLAVSTLQRALSAYGADHLTLALKCITCNLSNVGMVTEATIKALCHVLDAEPSWQKPQHVLLGVMREFDYRKQMHDAEVEAKKRRMQVNGVLAIQIFDYLDNELGA